MNKRVHLVCGRHERDSEMYVLSAFTDREVAEKKVESLKESAILYYIYILDVDLDRAWK